MDAKFLRLAAITMFAFSTACSKKGGSAIDAEQKQAFLSASSSILQLKKGYCLPNPILDEDDIVPLVQDGYKLSPADQYCLPEADGSFDPGDYNCVPYKFVDQYDLVYLINNGYHDTGTEYCNNEDGNNGGDGETTGGSTTAGSTDGGSTTAGSTDGGSTNAGSTDGGSTNAGSTDGGSTTAGSTDGGSTTAGSTDGGSTNAGSTVGGTTNSGSTDGGSTNAGSTDGGSTNAGTTIGGGATNGSTTAGSTDGGSTNAGSTVGGTTNSGSTDGGSTNAGTTNGGGATNGGSTDGGSTNEGGSTNGSTTGGGTTGGPTCDPEWNAPIDRLCSKVRTGNGKYIFENRKEIIVQVWKRLYKNGKLDSKTLICESKDTDKIKNDILVRHRVDLDNCDLKKYRKKDLYLTIYSPVESKDLPISNSDYGLVRFFIKGTDVNGKQELSFLLYGSRDNRYVPLTEKIVVIVNNNPDNSNVSEKECDEKASPLIVHVNPEHDTPKYVELTSIQDGVKFDILGLNAEPAPYAPKQVSWFANDQYMFLVKPNKQGKVMGIDQMFGDNTFGPDKDFAPNGFLALAKYDKNKDGVIDSDDSVYDSLRLWFDKNHDGIGTPNEMVKLKKAKVQAIDLRYDSSFREKDRYGNETVYKSVIQYEDGSLDLVFDLWFNYKKP